jgi:hypothetical protein
MVFGLGAAIVNRPEASIGIAVPTAMNWLSDF